MVESRVEGDRAPYLVAVQAGGDAAVSGPRDAGIAAALRRFAVSLAAQQAGAGPGPGDELRVEVHLPCGAAEPEQPLVFDDGSVFCQNPDLYHACLAGWIPLHLRDESRRELRLRANTHAIMDRGSAACQLDPLLRRYGLPADDVAKWLASGSPKSVIQASLLLRTAAVDVWGSAPMPGMSSFDPLFQPVARVVQTVLRRWVPYFYFLDPRRFHDPSEAWPYLSYSQIRLYRPKSRNEFAYEVSDREEIREALRGSLIEMQAETRRIAPRVRTLNLPREHMYKYSQRRAGRILQHAAGMPRSFSALLFNENRIIEALLRFGQEVGAGSEPKAAEAVKAGAELHRRLEVSLRRMCPSFDASGLAGVVLVEATAALAGALKRPAAVEAMLTLRDASDESAHYAFNTHFRG